MHKPQSNILLLLTTMKITLLPILVVHPAYGRKYAHIFKYHGNCDSGGFTTTPPPGYIHKSCASSICQLWTLPPGFTPSKCQLRIPPQDLRFTIHTHPQHAILNPPPRFLKGWAFTFDHACWTLTSLLVWFRIFRKRLEYLEWSTVYNYRRMSIATCVMFNNWGLGWVLPLRENN